jgi:hypothetical protein
VVEQVFGGLDAFGRKQIRHLWAYALHIHHRSVEVGHTPDAKTFGWVHCLAVALFVRRSEKVLTYAALGS